MNHISNDFLRSNLKANEVQVRDSKAAAGLRVKTEIKADFSAEFAPYKEEAGLCGDVLQCD